MSYLKFRADHLFTGYEWRSNEQVLIAGQKGEIIDIVPPAEAGDDILMLNGVLCPGFINCHCHLELSHLKGLFPERSGMVNFLLSVINRRLHAPEKILAAIAAAETAMLENGIVAVGDICNTADTIPQKQKHRLYYHNFIEAIGFAGQAAPDRFAQCRQLWEQFCQLYPTTVRNNSIVPHAPYSVSPTLFQLMARFAGNRVLTMHNQESTAENEFFMYGTGHMVQLYQSLHLDISFYRPTGKSSLQTVLPFFPPDQPLMLVHNVATSEEDMQWMADPHRKDGPAFANLVCCLCPNANLYIGNPLPDIDLLRRFNVPITIGTDSLASNRQLSILAELNTIRQHFPHIEIPELLQWATLNGARALGIGNQMGSFTKGTRPGIILIKNDWSGVKRLV